MKKIVIVLGLILLFGSVDAQIITDKTSKKISIGLDLYSDILTKVPADMDSRTINQGFNVHVSYNFPLGNSDHHFSIGTGIRSQNFYSNTQIGNIKADTIVFSPISVDYKRSKLNVVYLDFPAEFKFRFNNKWKLGVGIILGVSIDSKVKYVGDASENGPSVLIKQKKVNALEKYTFGPTLRFGYKWASLFAFYQPLRIFQRDLGPELYPLSVGVTISPF